jgi:hypothetical protein
LNKAGFTIIRTSSLNEVNLTLIMYSLTASKASFWFIIFFSSATLPPLPPALSGLPAPFLAASLGAIFA